MSDDLNQSKDANAVIREQRRRSTIDSITSSDRTHIEGTMLPNSVVRNQENNSGRRRTMDSSRTTEDDISVASPRRGSYWDAQLVENIRNSLQVSAQQNDTDDLNLSNKNLFRQNRIKVKNLEPEKLYSEAELTEQEIRRLKRAQRRIQATPLITELRRATKESLQDAMARSEEIDLIDEKTQDICLDTHIKHHSEKHKDHINAHKSKHQFNEHDKHNDLQHDHANKHRDHASEDDNKEQQIVTGAEKSEAREYPYFSVHEQKHLESERTTPVSNKGSIIIETDEDLNM